MPACTLAFNPTLPTRLRCRSVKNSRMPRTTMVHGSSIVPSMRRGGSTLLKSTSETEPMPPVEGRAADQYTRPCATAIPYGASIRSTITCAGAFGLFSARSNAPLCEPEPLFAQ